jgi:hypothetical protein
VTKTNYFAFFETRTYFFRESTSHSWNDKLTLAELEVFVVQVVISLQILILHLLWLRISQSSETRLRMNWMSCWYGTSQEAIHCIIPGWRGNHMFLFWA